MYAIGERTYPKIEKIKLKQYKKLRKLLGKLPGEDLKNELLFLLDNDLIEEVLCVIFEETDKTLFEEIDDETLVRIVTDFFDSKMKLMESFTQRFESFQGESGLSLQN
ncbi:MAG: hypothetical protein LCH52_05420 [Bacteroidetes bacterium]|nr:hypothetical protein [Bacteroidota bacterium]